MLKFQFSSILPDGDLRVCYNHVVSHRHLRDICGTFVRHLCDVSGMGTNELILRLCVKVM